MPRDLPKHRMFMSVPGDVAAEGLKRSSQEAGLPGFISMTGCVGMAA
ncbi:MAG: hypothetical protein INF81_18215 [Roseomonas sp.]|jgi:hypothetical protein|nr:hypothetical protein [Roseomonas sp.]MCA3428685.1 hypothetical protein [Roseomonas sp.]MCA3434597.1 hypothetical protein [Roseomonas sp.]